VQNPRKEAPENDLDADNRTLLELGLAPIYLDNDLMTEIKEVADAYSYRCDKSKIPSRSRWIQTDRADASTT
jgi:UDP-sulfoquinovose synthase